MPVNGREKNGKPGEHILWQDYQKTPSLILNILLQMSAGVPLSVQRRAELGKLKSFTKPYAKTLMVKHTERVFFPSPKSNPRIIFLLQMKEDMQALQ